MLYRQPSARQLHLLVMSASCWSASFSVRATLKCRFLPTSWATLCTCLKETAVCRGGIKRYVEKEKERKDYTFWRQLIEKPSITPGCPQRYVKSVRGVLDIKHVCCQKFVLALSCPHSGVAVRMLALTLTAFPYDMRVPVSVFVTFAPIILSACAHYKQAFSGYDVYVLKTAACGCNIIP